MRSIHPTYIAAIALALVLAFCAGGMAALGESSRAHRSHTIATIQPY